MTMKDVMWEGFASELDKLASRQEATARGGGGVLAFINALLPPGQKTSRAAARVFEEQAAASKRRVPAHVLADTTGKYRPRPNWATKTSSPNRLDALRDALNEPIRVSAMRLIAGHPGQGGVVSPGGPESTRGFPADVGENYSVSDVGGVRHKGPRKTREHRRPPVIERARAKGSPLSRVYDRSGMDALPQAIQGAGARAVEAVKRTPSKPTEQASNP